MKISFHAHHSPMGAHSSLTCGMHGARGGMAMEKGQPADGGVYVGYEDDQGVLNFLPLFAMNDDERARYVQGGPANGATTTERVIPAGKITRDLLKTLKLHLEHILVPGVCLYPDGGWKLSSTADNSWMSKINLCQHVARTILGVKPGKTGAAADHAHAEWECKGSEFDACSDQFKSGKAMGSKYYPRIVTNILWMNK